MFVKKYYIKSKNKSITHIICGFYCINFIKYMTSGKILLDHTNFVLITVKWLPREYVSTTKTNMRQEK